MSRLKWCGLALQSLGCADNRSSAEKIAFQIGSVCFAGVLSQDRLKN
jgi:hypothetical protein